MTNASDALQAIATTLGLQYIRSMNLSEANVDVHYSAAGPELMVYNGPSNVLTQFNGAEIIDIITCEIYFLKAKTTNDMKAVDIDTLNDSCKRNADKTYAQLNPTCPIDIEPYTLEAIEPFTELFTGFKMEIGIPFNNLGC